MKAIPEALPVGTEVLAPSNRRYTIEAPIGAGGFAFVHRARRIDDGARVALKVLHHTLEESELDTKRFEREVALLSRFSHPNSVELIDHGHLESGRPFIVLELLEGESLRAKLKREGALSIWRVGQVALQTLDALDAAHAAGVVHRDIKPGNIFMCTGEAAQIVRVLDFGVSKLIHREGVDMTTLTNTGQLVGTPFYMSPEQVGGRTITPAADIYAFGLVMIEMITGRRAVDGDDALEIYMQHLSDQPLPVTEAVTDSPLGSVVTRAVEKAVAARYPSAAAMKKDVAAALHRHHRALSSITS